MNARIKREPTTSRLPFPIIGKVKCGMKSEKGYPMSVDYFVPSGKYEHLFKEAYGDKPNTIQVVFPTEDTSLVCREEYELRDTQGKLVAKGDGENFKVWSEKSSAYVDVSTETMPNVMEVVAKRNPRSEWKVTLTLNFLIPKIRGIMGAWQFTTKASASSIPSIVEYFDMFQQTNGHISGVIFDLSVKMHTSNKPNDRSHYPVVSLVANESLENLKMANDARKPLELSE